MVMPLHTHSQFQMESGFKHFFNYIFLSGKYRTWGKEIVLKLLKKALIIKEKMGKLTKWFQDYMKNSMNQ